jgi:LysM repeat protein
MDSYVGGPGGVVPTGWTLTANVPIGSSKQDWVFNEFPGFGSSWKVSTSKYAFTMIANQFVAGVRKGTKIRFSAFANVFTCDKETSCITAETGRRVSERGSNARVRIGIDPTGGRDGSAGTVQWSPFISPFDTFQQLTLDSESQNDNGVTVFLFATQDVGYLLNDVYWDNVSLLSGAGAGFIPGQPLPTEVPRDVPFVTPQGQQPDGSIIHVVSKDDTLLSIAVAYGVSVNEIRRLNNIPPDEYVIRPGERLIIKTPSPAITYIVVTATPTFDPNAPTATATPLPVTATPNVAATRPPVTIIAITLNAPSPTPQTQNLPGAEPPRVVYVTATPAVAAQNPTAAPTERPVASPTPRPTDRPTIRPSVTQTGIGPTAQAAIEATQLVPTNTPRIRVSVSAGPTSAPPTASPTLRPSLTPSLTATEPPTQTPPPTVTPSATLTETPPPTVTPIPPTETPLPPTFTPTLPPTFTPTDLPTDAPTATPVPPTAVAFVNPQLPASPTPVGPSANIPIIGEGGNASGETSICVQAYEDANLNRLKDAAEPIMTGLKVGLWQGGKEVQAIQSGAVAETCFRAVAPGTYTLRAEAPALYGLTTRAEVALEVPQGATLQVSFGVAGGFAPTPTAALALPQPPPPPLEAEDLAARSPLLTLAIENSGILVLGLAAVVLVGGLYAAYLARRG